MKVKIAGTDAEIAACYPVMKELRPHIEAGSFVTIVRDLEKDGYRLAYLYEKQQEQDQPLAVAGFRLGKSLAWGRFLYVDDLVTVSELRSRGFGSALLSWLFDLASKEGCDQLHLDSGIQRKDAHRFYEREGLQQVAYHFARAIQVK